MIDLLDSANHLLNIWCMVFTPSMTGKFKPQVMLPGMLAVYTGMAPVSDDLCSDIKTVQLALASQAPCTHKLRITENS